MTISILNQIQEIMTPLTCRVNKSTTKNTRKIVTHYLFDIQFEGIQIFISLL